MSLTPKEFIEFLRRARKDTLDSIAVLDAELMNGGDYDVLRGECSGLRHRLQLIDLQIARHGIRKKPTAPPNRPSRPAIVVEGGISDEERRIRDVPEPPVFQVKEVEELPHAPSHVLAESLQRQGDGLVRWNYFSLGFRRGAGSRRYEGFRRG